MKKFDNGCSLEYIMSGCSYARFPLKSTYEHPEALKIAQDIISHTRDASDIGFGILYNAWAEKLFGKVFREHYAHCVDSIHADSGGLQVVTCGLQVTPDIKTKVYRNQAESSDIAMCFDEIPVILKKEKSGRNDLASRYFDEAGFEYKARQTGKNIFEQIQCFLDEKSTAKPILITQGNCLDTYKRWVELVQDEIPQEYHKYIGGVAMGAAALGHGAIQDIQRAFYFTQLPFNFEANHMHLLAVGSIHRLIPNLIFMKTGVFKDLHISLDSTKHSSGIQKGQYNDFDGSFLKVMNFPLTWNYKAYEKMSASIAKVTGRSIDAKMLFDVITNTSKKKYVEKFGEKDPAKLIEVQMSIGFGSVINFMHCVEHLLKDKDHVLNQVEMSLNLTARSVFSNLYQVQTMDDFNAWERDIGKFLTSKPVNRNAPALLEKFF